MNKMIKLINISKKIKDEYILKNITLNFNSKGFYVISGASGCGKTTLLNILAMYDNKYEGTYIYNGKIANSHRANIGYMNQKNIVFGDENPVSNIWLSNYQFEDKNIKNNAEQALLNLGYSKSLFKILARNLSGGEKQRLCYVMASSKRPEVLLCDEITSGLDQSNANTLLKMLKEKSKHNLVIMVSHDLELVKNYCDILIMMEDGKIKYTKGNVENENPKPAIFKKKRISVKSLVRLVLHKIKTKKFRFSLCVSTLTTGFICFCAAILISNVIKNNLNLAFGSIINKDEVILNTRLDPRTTKFEDIDYETYCQIIEAYPEYFENIRVNYTTNIDGFMNKNMVSLIHNKKKFNLPQLSLFSINNFQICEYRLNKDEIILGISDNDIRNLSMFFNISDKSLNGINTFLSHNNIFLQFNVEKKEWSYSDERIFTIKRCFYSEKMVIYHSNPLFNEIVFEEEMRFKNELDANKIVPWLLSKQYYLVSRKGDEFLKESFGFDTFLDFYPDYYLDKNNIILKHINNKFLNDNVIKEILLNNSKVESIKLCTNGSYLVLKDSMISGFSNDFLLANSVSRIDGVINAFSTTKVGLKISYPDNVLVGNITNISSKNLNFSSNLDELISGNIPTNDDEIVISSAISEVLFPNQNPINKNVDVAFLHYSVNKDSYIENHYEQSYLKVVGVKKSEKFLIYQNYQWLINYFRDYLNLSNYELLVNTIQYLPKNVENLDVFVSEMNQKYAYEFTNSSINLSSTINETIDIVELVLIIFSIFAICIAFIMLFLIVYLFIQENSNDFAAIIAIGGEKKDLENYKKMYISFIVLSSVFFTLFSLGILTIVLNHFPIPFFDISINDLCIPFVKLILMGSFILLLAFILLKVFSGKKLSKADAIKLYK